MDIISVPTEFHSTLCKTYSTLCILVRQPITEVKAEWNVAADVWEIDFSPQFFKPVYSNHHPVTLYTLPANTGCSIIYDSVTKFDNFAYFQWKIFITILNCSIINKIYAQKTYRKIYDFHAFDDVIDYIQLMTKSHFQVVSSSLEIYNAS